MKPFHLIVVDHDRKIFNVIENLNDDTYYNELIAKAQEGRIDLRCFVNKETLDQVKKQYERQLEYEQSTESII